MSLTNRELDIINAVVRALTPSDKDNEEQDIDVFNCVFKAENDDEREVVRLFLEKKTGIRFPRPKKLGQGEGTVAIIWAGGCFRIFHDVAICGDKRLISYRQVCDMLKRL